MTIAECKYNKLHKKYYDEFERFNKPFRKQFLELAKEELSSKYTVKRTNNLRYVFPGYPTTNRDWIYFTCDGRIKCAITFCIYNSEELFYHIVIGNIFYNKYVEKTVDAYDVGNMIELVEKFLKSKKAKKHLTF